MRLKAAVTLRVMSGGKKTAEKQQGLRTEVFCFLKRSQPFHVTSGLTCGRRSGATLGNNASVAVIDLDDVNRLNVPLITRSVMITFFDLPPFDRTKCSKHSGVKSKVRKLEIVLAGRGADSKKVAFSLREK